MGTRDAREVDGGSMTTPERVGFQEGAVGGHKRETAGFAVLPKSVPAFIELNELHTHIVFMLN